MSSFFTAPASQRKRKRKELPTASTSKQRQHASQSVGRASNRAPVPKAREDDDESISGSESSESGQAAEEEEAYSSDEEEQTAAEHRLKLAEQYLENIRAEIGRDEDREVGFDAADVDKDLIAARLKEDVAEEKGRVYRYIAAELDFTRASQSFFRADTLTTCGIAACPPFVYTVSKNMRLIKWRLVDPPHARAFNVQKPGDPKSSTTARRKQPKQLIYTQGNKNRAGDSKFMHHTASILCVAASSDGKFVATGGADRRLIIWDAATLEPLRVFTQHRDAVTAIAFRGRTNQLFSASKDRTIKIWSLNELAYVETLFGHQDEALDVDAVGGSQERCVSVGARDRTARLWKVVEESQLVFRGGSGGAPGAGRDTKPNARRNGLTNGEGMSPTAALDEVSDPFDLPAFTEGSLDRVAQIDTQIFVTGSDSGALSLFSLHKKKPLHVYPLAHGYDPPLSSQEASAEAVPREPVGVQPTPRWITALRAVPFSDLFVSGSWDGFVRVWRVTGSEGQGQGARRIELVGTLGSKRFENSVDETEMGAKSASERLAANGKSEAACAEGIRGVINDIAVFERGDRGKDGVCVVAAVGSETRLGPWKRMKAKNGAVVFEIPRSMINGTPQ